MSQYTSKRSKTCRCFSTRLLPMQPKLWRSQKTCSRWFLSQKIVVPELTSDIYLKGNPNSQGILNWIMETLHYYYRKQHKNIENSQIIEQNLVISLSLLFSLFTTACASFAFLAAEFFQFLKRHKWSFVKYIVLLYWFENANGFLQVKPS